MARRGDDLEGRFARRELVRDPPQAEPSDGAHPYSYSTADPQRGPWHLHHAAPFACTRWTNIWFPAAAGLFGDPFGGPLAELFGAGVVDRPVTAGRWWVRRRPFLAHISYWSDPDEPPQGYANGHHVRLLREALALDTSPAD